MTDRFHSRSASSALALILVVVGLGAAGQAAAQTGLGTVAFVESPELSPVAQALPRLVGDSPAIQSINADLAALDARDRAAFQGCSQWTRDVAQPMTGPSYVTIQINADKRCEGDFEGIDLLGISFDLAAGGRLDWATAIPGWNVVAGTGADDGLWASPMLAAWFSRRMHDPEIMEAEFIAECGSRFEPAAYGALRFKIWLDAERDALMVMAVLPDPGMDCFGYTYVEDDDLTATGLNPRVIAALHAAHEAGNWDDGTSRPGGSRAFQN